MHPFIINNSHSVITISAKWFLYYHFTHLVKMVPISNASDEISLHETTSKEEDHHFLFTIGQSANKQLYLLNHLLHSDFLNTILTIMWFQFKWYRNYHMIIKWPICEEKMLIHKYAFICAYQKSFYIGWWLVLGL